MKIAVALTLAAGVLSAPAPFKIGGSAGVSGHVGASVGGHASVGSALGGGIFVRSDEESDLEARQLGSFFPSSGSSSGSGFDLGSLFGGSSSSGSSGSSTSSSTPSSTASGSASASATGSGSSSASGSSNGGFDFGSLFGSSTSNDVTDNSGCKALTFIFARGTTEIGNMGTVVGPKVGSELDSLTGGKVAIQGVDYPADAAGNVEMGGSGGPEMAKLVQTAKKNCPDTKVVLGGYSQGAMVVHNAAGKLSSGDIVGAVTFGDPFKDQKPNNIAQFKTWCASGDPVCLNGANVMAHLSYGSDAAAAAKFLVNAAGL
ncbi:cutinase-domain-containing protein [Aspergillus filifer]